MSAVLALAAIALLVAASSPWPRAVRTIRGRFDRGGHRDLRSSLPTLVDALSAALGSGLSLPLAFAEIAPTLRPELAAATGRVAASLALGARIPDAMSAYLALVPAEDLAPITIVLASFARSGGRVGASLERVSTLLRGRLALEEERRALTAQARASAIVLVALAPLGACFFAIAMPDYLAALMHDGLVLLAAAVLLEVAGGAWLWWIVRSTTRPADLAMFLDAVVVGLDAGLTFERALAGLVERAPSLGRAADLRRVLADLALGTPLPSALRAFAVRPDEARVAALIAASTRFGAPLAHLLVLQAEAIRATDRHSAEAAARRLPVLMLFPLSLCILPALLVVFLGPPLLALLR
ncbi:MAG TPA: type II secretion system F family protein [Candidatus Limnocylindria bacterium]